MKFKGGKPRPAKPGQKQRKPGRPKGGVFLHKKGGKKAERQRAAAAAAAAAGSGGAAPAQGAPTQAAAGSKPTKPRPGAGAGLGGASGDADDFGYLLDDMPDYRPADEEGGEAGSGGEGGSDTEQPGGGAGGEGRPAKRRRKGGQKLSALEFEASRQLARQIADGAGRPDR